LINNGAEAHSAFYTAIYAYLIFHGQHKIRGLKRFFEYYKATCSL